MVATQPVLNGYVMLCYDDKISMAFGKVVHHVDTKWDWCVMSFYW